MWQRARELLPSGDEPGLLFAVGLPVWMAWVWRISVKSAQQLEDCWLLTSQVSTLLVILRALSLVQICVS